MIEATNLLWQWPGQEPVLERASFTLEPGLSLLAGPNGCGKSTLVQLLAGVLYPEKPGRITIDGFDLWQDEVEARSRLAYLPERPDMTPWASVREVLRLVAALRGIDKRDTEGAIDRALERVRLGDEVHRSTSELSLGQGRRSLLAAVMLGSPPNLLLDEPLESLDRATRDDVLAWVKDRLDAGASVLVTSHTIEPFLDRVDRVLTVREGQVVSFETEDQRSTATWAEKLARGQLPSGGPSDQGKS